MDGAGEAPLRPPGLGPTIRPHYSVISRATRPRPPPSETTEAAATAVAREAIEHADVSDLPAHESAAVIVLALLIALLVIWLLVWISRNGN